MCNYLLRNVFLENVNTWVGRTTLNGRKRGVACGDKKNYATPANEDIGQTSNWSKLVAAYLPVARLTILDRLVDKSVKGYLSKVRTTGKDASKSETSNCHFYKLPYIGYYSSYT